jgi:hypothetical protein
MPQPVRGRESAFDKRDGLGPSRNTWPAGRVPAQNCLSVLFIRSLYCWKHRRLSRPGQRSIRASQTNPKIGRHSRRARGIIETPIGEDRVQVHGTRADLKPLGLRCQSGQIGVSRLMDRDREEFLAERSFLLPPGRVPLWRRILLRCRRAKMGKSGPFRLQKWGSVTPPRSSPCGSKSRASANLSRPSKASKSS